MGLPMESESPMQVRGLPSMRKILISLGACVSPVLSAFVMLFIMASMYAQARPNHVPS